MPDKGDLTRRKKVVVSCRELCLPLPGGRVLAPANFELHAAERVWLDAPAEIFEAFSRLLTGQLKPVWGYLETIDSVLTQSDGDLLESLQAGESIQDYLQGEKAPRQVWLDGRRRTLEVLVDSLNITPADTRRPLKLLDESIRNKYWALRFALSRAQVLVGSGIFALEDPAIRNSLARRWADLPATLFAGGPKAHLPGPVETIIRWRSDGNFEVEAA